jgi:hypothetical protein
MGDERLNPHDAIAAGLERTLDPELSYGVGQELPMLAAAFNRSNVTRSFAVMAPLRKPIGSNQISSCRASARRTETLANDRHIAAARTRTPSSFIDE